MANVDKAFGLRPYKGAGWPVQQVNKYNIVMLLLTELLPLRITIQPLQRHLEAEL